jgi:hypothetical protein
MTVHVISVGLSVLDALSEPEEKFGDKYDLMRAIRDVAPWALMDAAGIGDRDRDEASDWVTALSAEDSAPRRALLDAVAAVRPKEWPLNLSAEIETFGRVQGRGGFSLSAGDKAIFICSDTPAGLLAGVWNALAVAGGDLDRVRYAPDPGSPLGEVRGRAVLVRVTGMDARNNAEFVQAMAGLGLLARHLFSSGSLSTAEDFQFYLSGGYKAAIPYLIGMAEAVRSVDVQCLGSLGVADLMPKSGPYPVKAYVLHETARGTPDTAPIELPLRRIVASVVRSELSRYKDGHRTGKPVPAILDGYAYDITDGKPGAEDCELTPFGAGLSVLFGLPREGFGG